VKLLEGVTPKLQRMAGDPHAVGLSGATEILEDVQVRG
jgi:hypothetical protein